MPWLSEYKIVPHNHSSANTKKSQVKFLFTFIVYKRFQVCNQAGLFRETSLRVPPRFGRGWNPSPTNPSNRSGGHALKNK